jgi:hypothetical protein
MNRVPAVEAFDGRALPDAELIVETQQQLHCWKMREIPDGSFFHLVLRGCYLPVDTLVQDLFWAEFSTTCSSFCTSTPSSKLG